MQIKLPKKSEIDMPDKKELDDLYFRFYHLKILIDKSFERLKQEENKIKELNKHPLMKRFRLAGIRIKMYDGDMKRNEGKFRKLFDDFVKKE